MAVPTLLPAVHISGGAAGPAAEVYSSNINYSGYSIQSVGFAGDYFYDDGDAATDAMYIGYYGGTSTHRLVPHTFDGDGVYTFTQNASVRSMDGQECTPCFMGKRKVIHCGYNPSDPSGYAFHADLYIYDSFTTSSGGSSSGSLLGGTAADREFYINAYRFGNNDAVSHATSNYAGMIFWYSADGTTAYTRSAKIGGGSTSPTGGGGTNAYDPYAWVPGIPTRVAYAGTDSVHNRGPNSKSIMWFNPGSAYSQTTNNDSLNVLDVVTATWNGSSGSSPAVTNNSNAWTLPTHTGSNVIPINVCCSFGNVFIHRDSTSSANFKFYPVTWSGSPGTPTIGSGVAYSGLIDARELYLTNMNGYGYHCGPLQSLEHPTETDSYNTIRIYNDGVDTYYDSVKIHFESDGSHTVTTYKTIPLTKASTTWTGVSNSIEVHNLRNGTDTVLIDKSAYYAYYVKNAYDAA